MSALTRKLLRTIKTTKGQFIALVAIMTLGVAVYITMTTAFYNLRHSTEMFYQEYNFADYYFLVIKAPEGIVKQVKDVPGVLKATGRIEKDLPIIKENGDRATGRLIGYPLLMDKQINRLHLMNGRLFDDERGSGLSVLVDPQYKKANDLAFGENIEIIAEGKRVALTIIGTAVSPEYIYPIKDANSMFPDPQEFGIIMADNKRVQEVLNMPGQINQVVIKLVPGADEKKIEAEIEKILEPYGNLASFPKKDQLSNQVMQVELDGLETASLYLPLIFFVIAVLVQFILLNRLIKTQRLQIGVMKALGYDNLSIIGHFTGYALFVTLSGFLLGTILGILMASGVSEVYAVFFNLPQTVSGINTRAVFYSFLISVIVGLTAGISASVKITGINPSEVMRPEPPISGGAIIVEKWKWLWKKLNTSWRMGLRSIFRNRTRFAITTIGLSSAVILLVLAQFTNDSVDFMLNHYYEDENRYDLMVHFTQPVKTGEIANWRYWEGVQRVEPLLEIPVEINSNGNTEVNVLTGLQRDSQLKMVFDEGGEIIQVPAEGMIINERIARKMGVAIGDKITLKTKLVQGPSHEAQIKVAGVNKQLFMAGGAFCSQGTANRIIKEQNMATSAMLKIDKELEQTITDRLNKMTGIALAISKKTERDNLVQLIDSMVYFIGVMFLFAIILGLAIVYNSVMMAFNERKKELASLRVIGLTNSDVSGLLFKETSLQAIVGILIGLPLGRILSEIYVNAVSTDLYSMPIIVYPSSYIQTVFIASMFVILGHLLAVRKLKKIDLVEALKNQD